MDPFFVCIYLVLIAIIYFTCSRQNILFDKHDLELGYLTFGGILVPASSCHNRKWQHTLFGGISNKNISMRQTTLYQEKDPQDAPCIFQVVNATISLLSPMLDPNDWHYGQRTIHWSHSCPLHCQPCQANQLQLCQPPTIYQRIHVTPALKWNLLYLFTTSNV